MKRGSTRAMWLLLEEWHREDGYESVWVTCAYEASVEFWCRISL